MITFIPNSSEGACSCTFCTDTTTISAGSETRIYNPVSCPAGTGASISELKIQSTDQSGFQVYTKDAPSSTEYYIAGSSASTVTCFNKGDGIVVGGKYSHIYVIIQCKEWIQSCKIRYTVEITCRQTGTTSTIRPITTTRWPSTTTSTSVTTTTTKPFDPSTASSIVVDNVCECQCCKGSAGCTPVYVGVIFYGTNRCEPTDCKKQCARQFSTCPANETESGKIVTQCRNNAHIGLKSSFYILFSTIIFLYIFSII